MSTVVAPQGSAGRISTGRILKAGLLAGAAAAVANLIVFLFETAVLGMNLAAPMPRPDGPLAAIGPAEVAVASFIPAIGAALLLFVLARLSARPLPLFRIIAVVFLLLSLAAPFTLPAAVTLGAKLGLALMHVVAGALIIWLLTTRTTH